MRLLVVVGVAASQRNRGKCLGGCRCWRETLKTSDEYPVWIKPIDDNKYLRYVQRPVLTSLLSSLAHYYYDDVQIHQPTGWSGCWQEWGTGGCKGFRRFKRVYLDGDRQHLNKKSLQRVECLNNSVSYSGRRQQMSLIICCCSCWDKV